MTFTASTPSTEPPLFPPLPLPSFALRCNKSAPRVIPLLPPSVLPSFLRSVIPSFLPSTDDIFHFGIMRKRRRAALSLSLSLSLSLCSCSSSSSAQKNSNRSVEISGAMSFPFVLSLRSQMHADCRSDRPTASCRISIKPLSLNPGKFLLHFLTSPNRHSYTVDLSVRSSVANTVHETL